MTAPGNRVLDPDPGIASVCPRCGYGNPIRARFCSACGLRLMVFCWSCGGGNRADATFCQNCGTQFADGRSTPTTLAIDAALAGAFGSGTPGDGRATRTRGADGRAATLTADDAARRGGVGELSAAEPVDHEPNGGGHYGSETVAAPPVELDEERRVVTVLFADIVGFTTLSERLDPEDAREIAAATQGKLVEAVALYGGTVDKFLGDAVMALFGAPVAHADDPIRAVHAALAMIQAMDGNALGQTDREGHERRVALRIGINTGEVIAGSRDVGGYREYSVYGDVVNTAARLQTAAEPGGILLGEQTARLAAEAFHLEPTEPLDLKGKEQTVQAYRVLGATHPAGGGTAGQTVLRGPLVGRLPETRRLRERLQELSRGRGQIVSIIGEHGVGKSRLLAEIRGYAAQLGLRWTEAHAPSYGQSLSYRMFREMIGELFGIQDGASDEAAGTRLWDGLRDLGVEEAYPHFAFVMGLPHNPATQDEFRRLGAEGVRRRAFTAVLQFFRTLASRQPLVAVLDDLQWADPSSVELLEELMALSDEVPILFCYVFTPDRDAPCWNLKELAARSFPHRSTELQLGPLSIQAAHELVCGLLDCAETPPRLEEMVLAKAEGNPYFVEEVLRALIDEGALRRAGDRWLAERDISEIHIPDTLLATVMARIDRLPEGVRRALQVAAVIGREFSERVLRRVTDGGPELDRHLREAQRAGLIREEATIPERRYAFSQILIQEAALRSLLLRRRKELHVQVGWALEELFADDLPEQYGELAWHASEGEDWERAFRYGRLAGDHAADAYANEEAVANYAMALQAAERSAAGADPEVVAELVERRSDVQTLVGEYDDALSGYESALRHHQDHAAGATEGSPERAREAAQVGQIALKLARLHSLRIDVPEVERNLDLAFANLPPDSPDLSSAWSLKSAVHIWRTEVEAGTDAAQKAMALAREQGSAQQLNAAYQALTQPAVVAALGFEGRELADEWVALAREQQDPKTLFRALTSRVFIHIWAFWSFSDEDLAETDEAARLARTIGSPVMENTTRALRGAGLFLRGRWDAAERDLRAVVGQPMSVFGLDTISQFWFARLLNVRGSLEEARGVIESVLAGPDGPHARVHQNAQLALNRRLAGDLAAANEAMERAAGAMDAISCSHCAVFVHGAAAEFYAESGDDVLAGYHIGLACEVGTQLNRGPTILAAERADAVLRLRNGDVGGALEELRAADVLAQAIDQPYETARTAHLLGRALHAAADPEHARDQLDRAIAIFQELRAEPDLAAARATMRELELS